MDSKKKAWLNNHAFFMMLAFKLLNKLTEPLVSG
jgi:hypothetical protein